MQTHSHFHRSSLHAHWSPTNVALAILLALLFLLFMLLLLIMTATPAQAQNPVPPTTAQSAKMPEFAAKLAHAGQSPGAHQQRMSHRSITNLRQRSSTRGPLDPNDLYDNGPIDGFDFGWTINFGFTVADSFLLGQDNSTVNGMSFGAWLFPGDVLQTVEISITSSPFGGNVFFDQVVNLSLSNCAFNGGYNICVASASLPNVALNAGTYWVNLQNAVVNNGDPVYWDENSGPSLASQSSLGTIPSESFTILGSSGTTWQNSDNYGCPPWQEGFQDLHDLPPNAASSGVAIDAGGHLYGAAAGGANGQGMLYELPHSARDWFLTTLYSFLGGDGGGNPTNTMLGPDGALYGSASGGIQSCGSDGTAYCGLIFKANPSPIPCTNSSCSWKEMTLYQFTGNYDAWAGSLSAFDSAGNLYGISASGGAYGQGAIFKLTPSSAGWTESIVYSFLGTTDGSTPNSLLVGHDGNLYGTASGGQYGWGVVFRLAPSGGIWTEAVLYAFTNNGPNDGYSPGGLVQDSAGNLYGFSKCYNADDFNCGGWHYDEYGLLFTLQPKSWNTGWLFWVTYDSGVDCQGYPNRHHQLAFDAAGILYAVQGGVHRWCSPQRVLYV